MGDATDQKTALSVADDAVEKAAGVLLAGSPVMFPTDTVYGLGLAVGIAQSLHVLCDIKGRDHGKPVAWLVEGPQALERYGMAVPDYALGLAARYWPGPLTLVVQASAAVPVAFRAPDGSIALRMPDHALAQALIKRVAVPLATTSANLSGQAPPRSFDEVDARLREVVPFSLVGSQPGSGIASTVIDCTKESPTVLREGSIVLTEV
ncbi:MAG: threonylcarbamoyl-AMP synthase [Coriobacteriaceae bacterium]|jgi:L-threonylcarbamoyladenylate synthase|nr:threonylcarbamoyl-AMP synthase [Coriobacteriaceae bacterium]